jgi:hypothetical protein
VTASYEFDLTPQSGRLLFCEIGWDKGGSGLRRAVDLTVTRGGQRATGETVRTTITHAFPALAVSADRSTDGSWQLAITNYPVGATSACWPSYPQAVQPRLGRSTRAWRAGAADAPVAGLARAAGQPVRPDLDDHVPLAFRQDCKGILEVRRANVLEPSSGGR